MPSFESPIGLWLDLSKAARYLGVHFTTLRRWADAGQVPCIRTPGGRRRFALAELDKFLDGMRQQIDEAERPADRGLVTLETRTLDVARQQLRAGGHEGTQWQDRFPTEQRDRFRLSGQRLLGLLMQFGSRTDAGEPFMEEGRRLAGEYGQACCQAGMSLRETVKTFLFFGHSMLGAVQRAGSLNGANDVEGHRLYQRMSDFLDAILLTTIDSYCSSPAVASKPPSVEG